MTKATWDTKANHTISSTKHALANLSIKVRTHQFKIFQNIFKPTPQTKVLDIGTSSDETLKDSNMFEKLYPFPKNLTAATIENVAQLKKIYPKIKTKKIYPHKKLPFKDNQFDIVVSWATLEHAGNYRQQKSFLKELQRVGKHIFVTTPYRGCFYEPHTGFPFLHWLPLSIFRWICSKTNRAFWSTSSTLNPLWVNDLRKMNLKPNLQIKVYKMFGYIPSHILIYS